MPDGMQFPVTPGPGPEPPTGPAGGGLSGNYPNPQLVGGPLNLYVLKAGDTMTGDLIVSHAGNVQIYVDSSDVSSGRPGFALTKRGTLEGIIQADGLTHGQLYYQSLAAGGVHQFFVNGVAVATLAAGLTSFPGGVSTIGNVTISGTVAGNARSIHFQTSGSERWVMGPGFDAESGGNAGSTFNLNRFSDAGAFLGTPFSIARATGNVSIQNNLSVTGPIVGASDVIGFAVWSIPTPGAVSVFNWASTGIVVDAQKWRGLANGTLHFQAIDDAGGVVQADIVFNRDGSITLPSSPATTVNNTTVATTGYVKAQGYNGISSVSVAGTMPNVGANFNVTVVSGTGTWYAVQEIVYIQDVGYGQVSAVNANQIGFVNLGHAINIAPGQPIPIGKIVVPSGPISGEISQNIQAANYTTILQDSGRQIYHAVAAAAATYTIPANATVAYLIGTTITFVNDSVNAVTIAITTDTLVLSPGGTTGSRTLGQFGVATALKVAATRWLISGTGLS